MVGGEQRSKTSPWPHLSRVAKKRKRAKQYERLEKRESWHRLGLFGTESQTNKKKMFNNKKKKKTSFPSLLPQPPPPFTSQTLINS